MWFHLNTSWFENESNFLCVPLWTYGMFYTVAKQFLEFRAEEDEVRFESRADFRGTVLDLQDAIQRSRSTPTTPCSQLTLPKARPRSGLTMKVILWVRFQAYKMCYMVTGRFLTFRATSFSRRMHLLRKGFQNGIQADNGLLQHVQDWRSFLAY